MATLFVTELGDVTDFPEDLRRHAAWSSPCSTSPPTEFTGCPTCAPRPAALWNSA
jgi:hypothetical protein